MAPSLSWTTLFLILPPFFPSLQPLLRGVPVGSSHWSTHLMLEFLKDSVLGPLPCSCFVSLRLLVCMSTLWWGLHAKPQTWPLFRACTPTCQLYIFVEYLRVQIYCLSSPELLIFSLEFAHSIFPTPPTALCSIVQTRNTGIILNSPFSSASNT